MRPGICATRECTNTKHSQTRSQTNSGTTYPQQQSDAGDAHTPETHKTPPRTRHPTPPGQSHARATLMPQRCGYMVLTVKPRLQKKTLEHVRMLGADIERLPGYAKVQHRGLTVEG